MSKIYTRTGDQGQTSLADGTRVSKTHPRLEAYGTVDELSSHLGLLASLISEESDCRFLRHIQQTLFTLSALLATEDSSPYRPAPLPADAVAEMEQAIDELQTQVPPLRAFILPGGSVAAAQAHVCRTVCRRAERRILALREQAHVDEAVIRYINRLGDYLFVLARSLNIRNGIPEAEHRLSPACQSDSADSALKKDPPKFLSTVLGTKPGRR